MLDIDLSNLPEVINAKFYALLNDKSRYMVLKGGASSGKSVFVAQKLIYRMLDEKGHKFLVVRKVKTDIRDSAFTELYNVIKAWNMENLFHVPTARTSELYIKCILNDNEILFYGLDDVSRRKSISGITGIWIEEAAEIGVDDFRQLSIRLRGDVRTYKQMILSFNPTSARHWLKSEFFDVEKENSTVHESSYKDNKFLPISDGEVLESFKDVDEYYYTVYALGQWGTSGRTVFSGKLVNQRLDQVKNISPIEGNFVYRVLGDRIDDNSIEFIEGQGDLCIYEFPIKGVPYVIGGDIAEGGTNWSVGQVRNNLTWNQAAVWRGKMDTDLYAKQMYCLGRFYNNALIGIETNFDSHPVKELDRLQYPRQYIREVKDVYTLVMQKKYGFLTNRLTRPIIIANYVALARESIELFNNRVTLDEMLTFVRDENGRPEAQAGAFDDCILADAIALEIRNQQLTKGEEKQNIQVRLIDKHKKSLNSRKKKRRHLIGR